MEERDPLRRVAQYRMDRLAEADRAAEAGVADRPDDGRGPAGEPRDAAPGTAAAPRPQTMAARGTFADELVRQAMARGEFDNLPLHGKPIPGIGAPHDPDWWLKGFVEREQLTGLLPEALQLRKDDAVLDAQLDAEHTETRVRELLGEFNARVVEARRQLLGGPPVVTPTRDVDAEVARWRGRRGAHHARAEARAVESASRERDARRGLPLWWRRGGGGRRRVGQDADG